MHALYYVRVNNDGTASVYSEDYTSLDALHPVEGSRKHVMRCATKIEADRQALIMQRESYRQARLAAVSGN